MCLFLFYQHKINHIDSRAPHKCEGSLGSIGSKLISLDDKIHLLQQLLRRIWEGLFGSLMYPLRYSLQLTIDLKSLSLFGFLSANDKKSLKFSTISVTSSQSSSLTSI